MCCYFLTTTRIIQQLLLITQMIFKWNTNLLPIELDREKSLLYVSDEKYPHDFIKSLGPTDPPHLSQGTVSLVLWKTLLFLILVKWLFFKIQSHYLELVTSLMWNASRICILFAIFHSFGLINVDEIRIALKVWMYNLFEYKGANFHHHFFPKGNRLFPSKFLWIVFTRFVLNTDFHAHNKACHKARDRSKKSWN